MYALFTFFFFDEDLPAITATVWPKERQNTVEVE